MKLNRISEQQAQEMIVYGKDKGFSIVEPAGVLLTIYHRIYKDKRYHIGAMMTTIHDKEGNEVDIPTYYLLDELEVTQLIGMEADYFENK